MEIDPIFRRERIFVRDGNGWKRAVNVDERGRISNSQGDRLIEINGRLENVGKDRHPELNSW